jgi:hypothetical protein
MYYKLVIDRTDYSYQYFRYTGTTGDRVGESVDSIKFYERNGIPVPTGTPTPTPTSTTTPTPTPSSTPTPTPTPTATNEVQTPSASFSTSTITASRTNGIAGTTTVTGTTTITVTNGTVTIRLKTWVVTGYRADTTIDIGANSYSPDFAGQGATPLSGVGEGNASSSTFTLGVGTYNITNWNVSAISDGTLTIAQAKLEQVI